MTEGSYQAIDHDFGNPIEVYDDPWPWPTNAERERCEAEAEARGDGMIEVPWWFANAVNSGELDKVFDDA